MASACKPAPCDAVPGMDRPSSAGTGRGQLSEGNFPDTWWNHFQDEFHPDQVPGGSPYSVQAMSIYRDITVGEVLHAENLSHTMTHHKSGIRDPLQVQHQFSLQVPSQTANMPQCSACGRGFNASTAPGAGLFSGGDYYNTPTASSVTTHPAIAGHEDFPLFIGSSQNQLFGQYSRLPSGQLTSSDHGPLFDEPSVCLQPSVSTLASFTSTSKNSCDQSSVYDVRSTEHQSFIPTLGIEIPQQPYVPPKNSKKYQIGEPRYIPFSMKDGGVFLVKDALKESYTGLKSLHHRGILGECGSSISIRIKWPGYEAWSCQIKTTTWHKEHLPISLAKLGTEVAKSLKRFIDKHQNTPVGAGAEQWQVGPVGSLYIHVNRLALIGLERKSGASWQPVLHLLP